MQNQADWIAVDCGADRVHLWAMLGERALAAAELAPGAAFEVAGFESLLPDSFRACLPDGPIDLVVCGWQPEAGASLTWRPVPAAPLPEALHRAEQGDAGLRLHLVPGLSQDSPCAAICGAETRIAGFLSRHANWDGVICLPGAHTTWAHVSADEVVSFQSFMTGEMLALLSEHSVLHAAIGEGWDDAAFDTALSDAMARPEALAARLSAIHAAHLLKGREDPSARARLSGLLIGAELAAARPYWLGQQVAVIGGGATAALYERALGLQGVPVIRADASEMTLAGLMAAHSQQTG